MTLDEAIKRYIDNAEYERTHGNLQGCLEFKQLTDLLKELKQLREQTRWIPVSERLPEEREWIGTKQFGTTISDEVYVTFEIPNGGRFCDHVRFQNGKLSPAERAKVNAIAKNAEPIAWMPLPEPYGEREGKE